MKKLKYLLIFLLIFLTVIISIGIKKISKEKKKIQEIKIEVRKEKPVLKNLNIQDFFDNQIPNEKAMITMIVTGDVIPARSVNMQSVKKNNFLWPYEQIGTFLSSSDITFINLESPIVKNCPPTDEGMIFCSDEKSIEGLLFAGVDIASLANNHIANYGYEGIDNTLNLLNGKSIKHCGVDNSDSIISIKGVNLGFSCFNQIGNWQHVSHAEEANITQVLQNLEKTSDLQILMFHWGEEYTSQPTDRQKQLAYFAIDNGADLIIGNHPHWIQPLEIYKNKLILYALGNFIFDQMWSEETKEGIVTKIYLDKNQIHDIELFPIYIENYGQVNFANEEKSQKILNALKKISS